MSDHGAMMISIPPQYAVSQVVGYIKGASAIHLARVYGNGNATSEDGTSGSEGALSPRSGAMRPPSGSPLETKSQTISAWTQ